MGVIVRALVAVACVWALYAWVWIPHRCSLEVTELTRRTDGAEKTRHEYERTVRARRNVADLARLREHAPEDVRVPMLIAANQLLIGLTDEAIRSYDEALRVEPRPEIYMARGEALVRGGRVDEAVDSYAAAGRFDPAFVDLIESPALRERVQARIIRRF